MTLEKEIAIAAKDAITKVVASTLSGYNSPLVKLIIQVVDENQDNLLSTIREVFSSFVGHEDFKKALKVEFDKKIAKTMVGLLESQLDKVSQAVKQDQTLRARMIIALENIINENK